MAKYQGTDGSVIEVGDASLNPGLVAGRTLVPDSTVLKAAPNTPGTAPYNPTGGPSTSAAPISRTISSDPATAYLDTFTAPESIDQITAEKTSAAQALIDSINGTFNDQVATAQKAGQGRVDSNNAISVLSGLSGGTEATRTDNAVKDANSKEVQAIQTQRAAALASVYSKISDDAANELEQQKQDATKSAEDILARRKDAQANALTNIQTLAASGADFDAFKNSPQNAQVYQYALDAAGGSEDSLKAIFAASRPKDQLVGTPQRVGDHYVQAYTNPLTGKVNYDTVEVPGGIPDTYNSFQTIGSPTTGQRIYAIPDNWDGDTSKLKLVASSGGTGSGSGGGATGYNGDFAATIDLAANTGGTNAQRAQIKQNIQSFIANKDYGSAYAAIVGATASALKGTSSTTFTNQSTSLYVLNTLQNALQQYQAAGGNTNIFKGTADQIQTKIGQLYTDPKYASLATQLDSAFQQYRLNMTGAAFGVQESAEYASVLPGKSNSLDLNMAKLNGAKAYLNSSVEGAIKNVVGQGGIYIKQYAEGATPAGGASGTAPTESDPLGLGI
jgi:hypothetical protein